MDFTTDIFQNYLYNLHMPKFRWLDIIEILIIAFLLYHILLWFKNTRAWSLMRGMVIILMFILVAAIANMTTILWIVKNVTGIAVTAMIILLQPELRGALEELGQKNFMTSLVPFDPARRTADRYSERTISELVRASVEMGKARTGALIVIEQTTPLRQYERTGIDIDAVLTSQLLINIFEKNTPLHDGAVIVRGGRVVSATCYLPLSENRMDKDLGTRHRAGVGISEVTDSLTIIVSEETGGISLAYKGRLTRGVTQEQLRERLEQIAGRTPAERRAVRAGETAEAVREANGEGQEKTGDSQ
ncbi:diadenylate cyclase CdaA [Lachnoclostridium sp. Marseille-P6806]|uniref:diadenylate cyclase CdaA n=1 Tax=Lachnoclostridium sp. Marseille-P6806 TaxID=2364793 RepID=UPI001030AA12|nr:diadenylate cyclase CdaA [Lachnoclostridium sp. Marseille-P6806]